VEGHERDHTAPGGRDTNSSPGTFHSTAAVSGGSCPASTRRCSWSRDTLDRVQFDMAAARSRVNLRYGSGSVAGARKQEKRGTRVEEDDEGVKSQFRARCAVKKGKSAVVRLECRARRVSGTSAHVRVPGEIGTRPRNASIPTKPGTLSRPRTVISNRCVPHDG
jgi:hypothetical protein